MHRFEGLALVIQADFNSNAFDCYVPFEVKITLPLNVVFLSLQDALESMREFYKQIVEFDGPRPLAASDMPV